MPASARDHVVVDGHDAGGHVEFAIGGIANKIFVSQYKTRLPSSTELQQLLMNTQDRWEKEHGKLPAPEIKRVNEDVG